MRRRALRGPRSLRECVDSRDSGVLATIVRVTRKAKRQGWNQYVIMMVMTPKLAGAGNPPPHHPGLQQASQRPSHPARRTPSAERAVDAQLEHLRRKTTSSNAPANPYYRIFNNSAELMKAVAVEPVTLPLRERGQPDATTETTSSSPGFPTPGFPRPAGFAHSGKGQRSP